jgi:hypothetical protein
VLRFVRGKGSDGDPIREITQFWLALPDGQYRLLVEEDICRA